MPRLTGVWWRLARTGRRRLTGRDRLRLGLLGLRLSEVASLNLGNLRQLPTITWTGKGHEPRQVRAGRSLHAAIGSYLAVLVAIVGAHVLLVRVRGVAHPLPVPTQAVAERREGESALLFCACSPITSSGT